MALNIKEADALRYAKGLDELGIDVADDMYSLEDADLVQAGMDKPFHRKKVLRQIHSAAAPASASMPQRQSRDPGQKPAPGKGRGKARTPAKRLHQ